MIFQNIVMHIPNYYPPKIWNGENVKCKYFVENDKNQRIIKTDKSRR